ncbi:hypothetical protein Pcinc_039158 [Petrolisthes cinctipes]|uniref:Anoctamin dimerisation domain-containing protein n=1 Tax=Petrolisthes cinctipes TaxID=88211 RepID=A0AAE1BPY9_PETCI|nr:hypothetical protein Pcinc_039158 [Petrolisthes cinctipes]
MDRKEYTSMDSREGENSQSYYSRREHTPTTQQQEQQQQQQQQQHHHHHHHHHLGEHTRLSLLTPCYQATRNTELRESGGPYASHNTNTDREFKSHLPETTLGPYQASSDYVATNTTTTIGLSSSENRRGKDVNERNDLNYSESRRGKDVNERSDSDYSMVELRERPQNSQSKFKYTPDSEFGQHVEANLDPIRNQREQSQSPGSSVRNSDDSLLSHPFSPDSYSAGPNCDLSGKEHPNRTGPNFDPTGLQRNRTGANINKSDVNTTGPNRNHSGPKNDQTKMNSKTRTGPNSTRRPDSYTTSGPNIPGPSSQNQKKRRFTWTARFTHNNNNKKVRWTEPEEEDEEEEEETEEESSSSSPSREESEERSRTKDVVSEWAGVGREVLREVWTDVRDLLHVNNNNQNNNTTQVAATSFKQHGGGDSDSWGSNKSTGRGDRRRSGGGGVGGGVGTSRPPHHHMSSSSHGASLSTEDATTFFRDGRRRIDYVLVYEEVPGNQDSRRTREEREKTLTRSMSASEKRAKKHDVWRQKFMNSLMKAGLHMEEETEHTGKKILYFIKVSAPWPVLCHYAEELNMRAPLQVSRTRRRRSC